VGQGAQSKCPEVANLIGVVLLFSRTTMPARELPAQNPSPPREKPEESISAWRVAQDAFSPLPEPTEVESRIALEHAEITVLRSSRTNHTLRVSANGKILFNFGGSKVGGLTSRATRIVLQDCWSDVHERSHVGVFVRSCKVIPSVLGGKEPGVFQFEERRPCSNSYHAEGSRRWR